MASKKISQIVTPLSFASKSSYSFEYLVQILMMMMMLSITPTESFMFKSSVGQPQKKVVITNNHTLTLTLRCFNFYQEMGMAHLKPRQSYQFSVRPNRLYPSSTMWNCSTNMGVFTAYRFDYECSSDVHGRRPCKWRFDQDRAYRKENGEWEAFEYSPNYESHGRGGVLRGYFTN